jgi:hypothetical protein
MALNGERREGQIVQETKHISKGKRAGLKMGEFRGQMKRIGRLH